MDYEFIEEKPDIKKNLIILNAVLLSVNIVTVVFFLLIRQGFDAMGFSIAFEAAGALFLLIWWLTLMTNYDLFSAMAHGFKSFFRSFTNKKREPYYEYLEKKKKVPKYVVVSMFIYVVINLFVGITMHVMTYLI